MRDIDDKALDALCERLAAYEKLSFYVRDEKFSQIPTGYLSVAKDAIATLRARLAEVEREMDSLRSVVSKCADALGNGAFVPPDCSIEFMESLPGEIGLHVASLAEDRETWRERAEAAEAREAKLREALKPFAGWPDDGREGSENVECLYRAEWLRAARAASQEDGE